MMQSGVEFCTADAVVELRVKVDTTEGIELFDVHLTDKIGYIKERVCDEVTKQFGNTYACEPAVFTMLLFPSLKALDNDLSKTLSDVLTDIGIINDVNQLPDRVVVELYPIGYVFGVLKDNKKEEEEDRLEYREGCLDEDSEEEEDDEEPEPDPEDAFSVKRPDGCILPARTATFRLVGDVLAHRVTDHGEKRRYIPYVGLTYPLEQVAKLTISTTTSLVLLVFNSENLDILMRFTMHTCTSSKILLLQVSWDKFSYLFLRMLRQNLGPRVPIVAVTDMDVHHLDLLAFLDTPPRDLPRLYDWNLSQDCAQLGVLDNKCVDIKWLGIRPSDMDASSYSSCFDNVSHNLPLDFSKVYDFLLTHPHLSKKNKWVEELHIIAQRRLHRSLPYLWQGMHWGTQCYVWKNYLPLKIMNMDWI